MTTSVISLAEPFFLKVLGVLDQPIREDHELHKLQRRLTADLQAIEQRVNAATVPVSQGDWQTIKRVLVYWADEVLTSALQNWDDYTLEQEYFGEQNRAWKFYVEGEEKISTSGGEVAEFFYLAIVLGFIGDIEDAFTEELKAPMPGGRQDEHEARRYWARQLQSRIQQHPLGSIQGEPLEGDVEPLSSNKAWQTGLAAFLIALLMFLITLGWNLQERDVTSTTPGSKVRLVAAELTH